VLRTGDWQGKVSVFRVKFAATPQSASNVLHEMASEPIQALGGKKINKREQTDVAMS